MPGLCCIVGKIGHGSGRLALQTEEGSGCVLVRNNRGKAYVFESTGKLANVFYMEARTANIVSRGSGMKVSSTRASLQSRVSTRSHRTGPKERQKRLVEQRTMPSGPRAPEASAGLRERMVKYGW